MNRVVTGSNTANTLNANSAVTWDGTQFIVRSSDSITSYVSSTALAIQGGDATGDYVNMAFNGNGYAIGRISGYTSNTNGTGQLIFSTANSGSMSARMFLNQNGHLMPNTNNTYDLGANTSYRWRTSWCYK